MRNIGLGIGSLLFFAGASAMDSKSLAIPIAMILIGGILMLINVYMINGPQDCHLADQ